MGSILALWDKYQSTILLDLSSARGEGPVDVDHFRTLMVENAIEKNEEKLMNAWFPQVTSLFSGDTALVVGPQKGRFFDCVTTLITNQVSCVKLEH